MSPVGKHLRPNAIARPLLNHWVLWDMLLPPPAAALVVAKSHIPTMSSYLEAPEQHAEAARTPGLRGGPWIDYPTVKRAEIAALLEKTRVRQAGLLELAAAIRSLDELLRKKATGGSLEALYAEVPAPLRGFVELVYDLDDHPGARFLEGLFYRSPYFDRGLQHFALETLTGDHRAYERSTPVLDDGAALLLNLPFADRRLDQLFAAENAPTDVAALAEQLGLEPRFTAQFARLFTDEAGAPAFSPPAGLRVRYFGHACLLLESPEVNLLTDPFVAYELPGTTTEVPRYTFADLPDRIDYVLITHGHSDHIRPEVLLRLRHRVGTVVVPRSGGRRLQDPSLKLMLQALGFANVVEMHELDTLHLPGGTLTALPFLGEHGDLDIAGKCGYHLRLAGRTAALLADACTVEPALYRRLAAHLGPLDALFLGMECAGSPLSWGYGHLFSRRLDRKLDQARRDRASNAAEAIAVVNEWRPSEAHVYAMGQEPWLNHVLALDQSGDHLGLKQADLFVAHCRSHGLRSERLFGQRELFFPAR